MRSANARTLWLTPLLVLAAVLLLAACSGGNEAGSAPSTTAPSGPAATSGAFPTGPAVLVAADYQAPGDRVASTGAYVPANGKPTLVFVDAIW